MPEIAGHHLKPEKISFLVVLLVCTLGLNLFIHLESRAFLERSHQVAEDNARQWTNNLALALEREISGNIGQLDVALLSVIDEIERHQDAGKPNIAALEGLIARLHQRLPLTDGVRITDANGILRYGTDVSPSSTIDLSDREHFRTLMAQPNAGLVVSHPQRSRTNGKWVVVFARRINGRDGSFQGMAFIPVPIASLTDTFSKIRIPEKGSITLRSAKLEVIARYPTPQDEGRHVGQAKVGPAFVKLLQQGATEGSFFAVTPLDGIPRLLSFRKVGDFPLLLIVGRAESEYLSEWSKERRLSILTQSSFLALSLLISAVIYRYWRRITRVRDEMAQIAKTDYLTGLANRREFIHATESEIARSLRYGKPLSLLMFDADHFKAINDTYGHEVGDQALQHLADCARKTLREVDLVGRWGGEEFVALLPETDVQHAAEAAERLRSNIEASPVKSGDITASLTVSIGYTALSAGDSDINALIKRADDALYSAKEQGRNRIHPMADSVRAGA